MGMDDDTPRDWWGAPLLSGGADESSWAFGAATVTRAEIRTRVAELTRLFAIHGIRAGSTVALQIPPSFTWMWALLALWARGAQVMLFDHRLAPAEVNQLSQLCRPQFHLGSEPPSQLLKPFKDEREILVTYRHDGRPAQDDHAVYQFSSGSMGRPKVIGRTADSLLAEVDRFARIDQMPRRGERVLLLNSLSHSFGLIGGFLHALNVGATLVFPPRIQAHDFLDVAARRRVNVVFGVPVHFDLFSRIDHPPALPHLRMAVSGGEMLPRTVFERFQRCYGIRIGQAYGMTEVGIIATDLLGAEPPPSVGRLAPGIEAKVDGGELSVRLEHTPYIHADEARWSAGWLRTRDLAEFDPITGTLAIMGRADSMAVIGGLNVDLTEVETALLAHDQISEAVVVHGDVIEAHVAAEDLVAERDLATWCRERLSGHKVPRRFYVVRDLPRTANGKLVRSREILHAVYARRRDRKPRATT
jgi:acyl-coenzyme A synthetase/AMP-(fatty) acid ligase